MQEQKNEPEISLNELKNKLAECEKLRDEYLDGWRRTKADFINYKKDETERFAALVKFSNESLVLELLNVLDSFDLGLTILKNNEPAQKGMFLIKNQLEDLLKKYGLEKISVTIGQPFEPTKHEAVAEIESEQKVGTIAEEIEKGYTLNGKIIRQTRVKIAK